MTVVFPYMRNKLFSFFFLQVSFAPVVQIWHHELKSFDPDVSKRRLQFHCSYSAREMVKIGDHDPEKRALLFSKTGDGAWLYHDGYYVCWFRIRFVVTTGWHFQLLALQQIIQCHQYLVLSFDHSLKKIPLKKKKKKSRFHLRLLRQLQSVIDLKASVDALLCAVSLYVVMVESKTGWKASCQFSRWKGEAD